MNKIKYFLIGILSLSFLGISGCTTTKIVKIMPQDQLLSKEYKQILQDKDLNDEEKIQAIQIKMAAELDNKKKAVEMERDNKLSSIINKPVTPLRTPDTILRVLILPYESSNGMLNSWKYSYIKVEDGKWVLSDYLNNNKGTNERHFTPLSNSKK